MSLNGVRLAASVLTHQINSLKEKREEKEEEKISIVNIVSSFCIQERCATRDTHTHISYNVFYTYTSSRRNRFID